MTGEQSEERTVEPRCWLESKLEAMDRKLDHIIYRLWEEDARTHRPARSASGPGRYHLNQERAGGGEYRRP